MGAGVGCKPQAGLRASRFGQAGRRVALRASATQSRRSNSAVKQWSGQARAGPGSNQPEEGDLPHAEEHFHRELVEPLVGEPLAAERGAIEGVTEQFLAILG